MQTLKLDINPKGETPVLYVSQYDNGREFGIELVEGDNAYNVPSGYSVQLNVRKTDSKLVTKTPETVTGNILTFVTTTQMTACSGNNIASLTLKDTNDIVITTLYFIIEVQRDVLAGGLDSVSEIDNLTQQIEDITQEVIGDDYYNKTETDALIEDKADKSDTYTKAQVDTALSAKADTADLATVATSGNYDDLINKPTIPAAQIQSDYTQADTTAVDYIKNKPDIDAMIAAAIMAIMPVETQTGNPCSFDTDIVTALQSLMANIVASGGNGTPSTPNPIVGHSELNLVRCGVNLWDEQTELGLLNSDGSVDTSYTTRMVTKNFIPVVGGKTYAFVYNTAFGRGRAVWYDANKNVIQYYGDFPTTPIIDNRYALETAPANACYFKYCFTTSYGTTYLNDMGMNYPSSNTYHVPYNGQTFTVTFGQTVYGGVYDANSGKITPNTYYPSYNGETITGRWLSSKDVYVEGNQPTTGAQVVCLDEYDTPIDVSELSVDTIVGTNNITSDCNGDVTASYKVSIQKYVDEQ